MRRPFVGLVRYGAGNIGNVVRAMRRLGFEHELLDHPQDRRADILVLPGVGAFRPAMQMLVQSGWAPFLREWAASSRPLVGICVGMQLMCRSSDEDGRTEGLGIFDAEVSRLDGMKKIPHMGWNTVEWRRDLGVLEIKTNDLYFVHSYAPRASRHSIGTTEADGVEFTSALAAGSAFGVQFHPERSGVAGVSFLGSIIDWLAEGGRFDA